MPSSRQSKSPNRVTASLEPATEKKGQKKASRTSQVTAPPAPDLTKAKKMLSMPSVLAVVAVLFLVFGALPCMMLGGDCTIPGLLSGCSSCDGAYVITEGATVPVDFAGVTYLLADKSAAAAFIESPEGSMDYLTKAMSLWANLGYISGDYDSATLCSC